MVEAFLARYFHQGKLAKLRNEISPNVQTETESLFETWDRFRDLLRRCPQYGFPDWMIVHTFNNGVNLSTGQLLDVSTGGVLGKKVLETTHQLIEDMAMNNNQWNTHEKKMVDGIHEVDVATSLANQVEALSKKIVTLAAPRGASVMLCEGCGEGHS